jgi:hypothetical protein
MRHVILLLSLLPLWAQEPAAQPKPEEAKPAEEAAAVPPSPVAESWVTGSVDVGARWLTDIAGSRETYRSVVDLGEGPKLFGLDLTFRAPNKKLFDEVRLFAIGWGGDPYNTARVEAGKQGLYRLNVDYRNLAYYNFLPSFANPATVATLTFNQRGFDIHRRYANTELELFPGRRVVPYLVYTRDSGFGRGVTPFESSGNEYPVASELRDKTDHYRGGVRLEMRRWHVTLEQGGSTFKDDQRNFTSDRNPGNRTTPVGGQTLLLDRLNQAYGIRGDSIYSKALFTASPASWADVHGQFLFSRPRTDVSYQANAAGLFVLMAPLQFFTGAQEIVSGAASLPHTSGNAGFELRPWRRLRIVESWTTDRLENTSSALLAESLFSTSGGLRTDGAASDRLEYNHNRQQLDVLVDVAGWLTLRGGHRYVWGDAQLRPAGLSPRPGPDVGELRRHVALAGASGRAGSRASWNVDFERGAGDRAYFRTSLHDYTRIKARWRLQVLSSLALVSNTSILTNDNPAPSIDYNFDSFAKSLAVHWTPGGGKRFTLLGEYTFYRINSDISYLVPQTLERERSLYRDKGHSATAALDINLPGSGAVQPKLGFGGSLLISSGSRPTRWYQPFGRVTLPLTRNVAWYAEWRYYGFSEIFYRFEDFRTHHFVIALRFTL